MAHGVLGGSWRVLMRCVALQGLPCARLPIQLQPACVWPCRVSQPQRGHKSGFLAPGVCRNDRWVVCASSVGCQMPFFYVFFQRSHRNVRKVESWGTRCMGQSVNLLPPPLGMSPKWPLYPRGIHAELMLSVRLHGYQCTRWCTAPSSPSWTLPLKNTTECSFIFSSAWCQHYRLTSSSALSRTRSSPRPAIQIINHQNPSDETN